MPLSPALAWTAAALVLVAAILVGLAVKVFPAGRQDAAEQDEPDAGPSRAREEEGAEDYAFLAACSPHKAEEILRELQAAGVRFLLDVDLQAGSGALAGQPGPVNPVKIYVHRADEPRARAILERFGPV